MPDVIQFRTGDKIVNTYNAGGKKLRSDYYTYSLKTTIPLSLSAGDINNTDYSPTNYTYTGTAYVDNKEYTINKTPVNMYGTTLYVDNYNFLKLYNPEGYITGAVIPDLNNYRNGIQYNYFRKDHVGNIHEVWQAAYSTYSGTVAASTLQRTSYYPSGLPWYETTSTLGSSVQPRKYGGKEYIEMDGLDEYDSQARNYYATLPSTPTMDPLCEKYYSISPYSYCAGNPVNRIDPDGMDIYLLNNKGQYILALKTEDNHDILIAQNKSGQLAKNSDGSLKRLVVNDNSLMPQLAWKRGDESNSSITSSGNDAFNVWKFSVDNSKYEWSLSGFKDKGSTKFYLNTDYDTGSAQTGLGNGVFKAKNMLFNLHDHPSEEGAKGGSGYNYNPPPQSNLYNIDSDSDGGVSVSIYNQTKRVMPLYVYYPQSRELYKYTPWNQAARIWKGIDSAMTLQRIITPK